MGQASNLTTAIFYHGIVGIGAMVGPIIGGHLIDVMGTFRWSFGIGALAALLAGLLIGFLRSPEENTEKED